MGLQEDGGGDQMGGVTPSLASLPTRPGENLLEGVSWECPLTWTLGEARSMWLPPGILIARGSLHWGRKRALKSLTSHGTDT